MAMGIGFEPMSSFQTRINSPSLKPLSQPIIIFVKSRRVLSPRVTFSCFQATFRAAGEENRTPLASFSKPEGHCLTTTTRTIMCTSKALSTNLVWEDGVEPPDSSRKADLQSAPLPLRYYSHIIWCAGKDSNL